MTERALAGLVVLAVGLAACAPGDGATADLLDLPAIDLDPNRAAVLVDARASATDASAAPEERAAAYVTLGRAWLAQGLGDAAATALTNAIRLDPLRAEAHYLLALADAEQGRAGEAEGGFRRALELRPDYLPARIRLGRLLADRGATDDARRHFEAASAEPAFAASAHTGLGRIAVAAGDAERAARHFEQALAMQPDAGRLRYQLGQAYLEAGDSERAAPHLEAATDSDVTFPDPWVASASGTDGPADRLNAAGRAFFDRRYEEAVAGYRVVLSRDPDNVEAHRGLALSLARLGDGAGAIAAFREALRRAPDDAELERGLGALLLRTGDPTGLERLQRAVELDPGSVDSRVALGDALRLAGRPGPALEQYDAALATDPGSRPARHGRAAALLANGATDQALALLRDSVREDPGDHVARANLGAMLVAAGDHAAAEPVLRAVLDSGAPPPLVARAHFNLGIVASARGNAEAAQAEFAAAVSADGLLSDARLYFAAGLARDGRYAEAAEHLARVVEQEPDNARARLAAATALVLSDRPAAARRLLEEGIGLLPGDRLLTLALARVLATSTAPEVRDGRRALDLAERLHAADASLEHTEALAAALAELGRFDRATSLQQGLVAKAREMGDTALAGHFGRDLERYRRGLPSRIPPETPR